MFLCSACHPKECDSLHCGRYGPCESCGRTKLCKDCHYSPPKPLKRKRKEKRDTGVAVKTAILGKEKN